MPDCDSESDAHWLYGEWLAKRDQLDAIDYGQRAETHDAHREDLRREIDDLAARYRALTGRVPK